MGSQLQPEVRRSSLCCFYACVWGVARPPKCGWCCFWQGRWFVAGAAHDGVTDQWLVLLCLSDCSAWIHIRNMKRRWAGCAARCSV